MRFLASLLALAAVAFAQSNYNAVNTPMNGFGAQAGQQITITWTNPSGGNVDIRLTQGGTIAPGSGVLLATVPASAGSATVTLPDGASLNGQPYNFEMVPVDDPSNPNFSSQFVVAGASGTGSSSGSSSMSMTDSSSSTATDSTATSTDSTATTTDSSSSGSTSASTTSHRSSSGSNTASASAVTTSAPSSNGAASMPVGGLLAMVAGAIAVF